MRLVPAAAAALAFALAGCALDPAYRPPSERDEIVRRLVELEKQATKSRLEIERLQQRLAALESAGAAAAAPPPRAAEPAEAFAAEPPPVMSAAPRAAIEIGELADEPPPAPVEAAATSYEAGLALLRDGEFAEAERALAAFAAAAPDSDLADNAGFWIGESRLARGDLEGALEAYRDTLERYPEGNKVPDALLKLGHALAELGNRAAAREAWSELVARFPQTAAAERAKERLAEP